jgi:hypothetical protein
MPCTLLIKSCFSLIAGIRAAPPAARKFLFPELRVVSSRMQSGKHISGKTSRAELPADPPWDTWNRTEARIASRLDRPRKNRSGGGSRLRPGHKAN